MCPTLLHATKEVSYQLANCVVLSARFVGPDLGNLSADIISCREKGRIVHGSLYKVRGTALILDQRRSNDDVLRLG